MSLEVKLLTIWSDGKAEVCKAREEKEKADQRRESQQKKMQVRDKVGKPRNTMFFHMICCSGGSKSRLAKGASWPGGRRTIAHRCGAKRISKSKCSNHLGFGALLGDEMGKKCTLLWCNAHVQMKSVNYKKPTNPNANHTKNHKVASRKV